MAIEWQTIIIVFIMLLVAVSIPAAFQIITSNRNADKVEREMTELHLSLNSRLSELLDLTAKASRAEGVEEERTEARARGGTRDG